VAGFLDILPCKLYPRRQLHNFSPAWVPGVLDRKLRSLAPDLVHLHWVGDGFLRIETLGQLDVPLVWTLHDSWPFTGGCYLPGPCRRYEAQCGSCQVLASDKERDLSQLVWQRKRRCYPLDKLTVVAPSRWMAKRARSSSLFAGVRIEVIPNGIDTELFRPGDRMAARQAFGLDRDHTLILFGAKNCLSDVNKGFDLFAAALAGLGGLSAERCSVLLIGESGAVPAAVAGIPVVSLGQLGDEAAMAQVYRAADFYVLASREENLPNMISEAMACGTPCIAFDVGGVGDQIEHHQNGCLTTAGDTRALAEEIAWMLADDQRRKALGDVARRKALDKFDINTVAARHIALYEHALKRSLHVQSKD
jgi:glycosyltransferase involved in cell wall biosynthesis